MTDSWQSIGDVAALLVPHLCPHGRQKMVWKPTTGNLRQLRHQCLDCGRVMGGSLKHALAPANTPLFDEALQQDGERLENEHWQKHWHQRARDDAEWRSRYEEHLGSEKWRELRRRVLKRAGGICEGCGIDQATECHHLTYTHTGDEFLFELTAVCSQCHRRIHGNEN
jgi:hypothetical protein